MMRVLTIDDLPLVAKMVSHDSIWPWIHDDLTPDTEEAKLAVAQGLLSNPSFICLSPNVFTVFGFQRMNAVTYEVHTLMLPEGRGRIGFSAGKETARWMFDNTPCRKLIGLNPANNRAVTSFALKVGFKREGIISKSWLYNNVLYDRIIVGLSKDEVK